MEVSGSEPTQRGLIHVHHGRTDVFTQIRRLSGDIIAAVSSRIVKAISGSPLWGTRPVSRAPRHYDFYETGLVQRYRSIRGRRRQMEAFGLATHDGLTRWKNGQTTIFRKANGLPDDVVTVSVSG